MIDIVDVIIDVIHSMKGCIAATRHEITRKKKLRKPIVKLFRNNLKTKGCLLTLRL